MQCIQIRGAALLAFLIAVIGQASACGSLAPAPTPTVTLAPSPTITPLVIATITVREIRNIPACDGFAELAEPVAFTWQGIEDAQDVGDWGYFRCGKSRSEVAALYREKMIKPPYLWQEFNWVELSGGTLGVYFHAVYQRWLYLWVLPVPADAGSFLVLAQRDLDTPLVLPCCQ